MIISFTGTFIFLWNIFHDLVNVVAATFPVLFTTGGAVSEVAHDREWELNLDGSSGG